MTDSDIISLALQTMLVALKLSAPILVTSLVIGFTLSFVPKLIGVGIALLICGNWMLHTLVDFTVHLFNGIPALLS